MFWVNLCVLFLIFAGHCELVVAAINRIHATRLRCGTLRHLRHVHDVVIIVFPVVIVWQIGFSGPQLLSGGSWQEVPTSWMAYFAVCCVGLVSLVINSAKHQLRTSPPMQQSKQHRVVDIAKCLGRRPIGPGRFQRLVRIPGNETFRVEVSETTLQIPNLPQQWDGLSILHLSDFHYIGTIDLPFYEQIIELSKQLEPDLIVFTGDLLDQSRLVDWLAPTLGQLHAPLGCYFVLGNHDWYLGAEPCRQVLTELGWICVAGNQVTITHNGHTLSIGGTELPWMGEQPDFSTAPLNSFRLLLSHTADNLPWAREQAIDLMLSGHNHGGQVRLPIIGPVYSPSRYGCKYSSGLFWEEPTLLYVSRGVAGCHPLRWNCLPEITKLTLRPFDNTVA